MEKVATDIYSFRELREKGFTYVDKTAMLLPLADLSIGKQFFIARPRRFGKSLLISTLHCLFEGRRELFKGLAIEQLEHDWTEYPVLHLDLNTQQYGTEKALHNKIERELTVWESTYGKVAEERDFGMRFEGVIKRAYEKTGRQVVILVDEYDKPLLQAIGNVELQDAYRATLKGFYGALKSMDGCIRFAFLTGVTKFGKVSVFSDLNNLRDLSMLPQYFDICGITEDELRKNFKIEVSELASAQKMTIDEAYAALRENYDGYHFCEED